MDPAEEVGQDPRIGHRVLVTGDHVVEGEHASEHARDEQHVHDDLPDRAEVVERRDQDHRAGVLGGLGDDATRAPRHHERPGGERVEDADADHGGVGRPRDGAAGVLRLVPEDRGRLEADEGGDREHQADRGGTGEHVVRFERRHREALRAAVEDHGCDEHEHNADLADQEHPEHFRAQVDVPIAEDSDEGDRSDGVQVPRHIRSAEVGHGHAQDVADVPVDRDLDRCVGEQGEERRRESGRFAEAVVDEGEECSRLGHVPGHRGETDREEEQHHGGDGEHRGEADPVAQQDAERGGAADHGQRGGGGDHHQHDGGHAEGAGQ